MSGFYSKDGSWHPTAEGASMVDAKIEQERTRLLKEQTELLRKQQQEADRARWEAELERQREIEAERQRRIQEILDETEEEVDDTIDDYASTLEEEGIGDPHAYINKMLDLYRQEERNTQIRGFLINENSYSLTKHDSLQTGLSELKNGLERLDETDKGKWNSIINRLEEIYKSFKEKAVAIWAVSVVLLVTLLCVSVYFQVEYWDVNVIWLIFIVMMLIGAFLPGALYKYPYLRSPEGRQMINDYNAIVTKAWYMQNKMFSLEERRLERFNGNIEECIIKISEYLQTVNTNLRNNGITSVYYPDLRFRFHEYPEEFLLKRTKAEKEQKKEDGMDIFDNL